ncbi:hypothetical protein [Breznakiella homolactica]|uniref:Uncharacterized protein n=1 Tax=Breznakiella homolactica TaxID=2798577 RepID=A0A7T8B9G3_9SPIR|nr:hypothetical protein [Breznakiella homolactica]QQO08301.1 hypothetical protein JFL75_15380 [Breznakiella homolactica]
MKQSGKFLPLIFFFILTAGGAPLFGAESDIDVSIRYFDKRVYYVKNDPILVQLTIANRGTSTYRFKLADERIFSVDFDIRTMANRAVNPTDILVRKRTQNQQVFFREVSVEPGESFSFIEDLRDYGSLDQAGSFIIQAKLYPELLKAPNAPPIESNRLSLSLRPVPVSGPGGVPLAMDVETNAILVREKLSPDQVVDYLISARQKEQWEKFFLYLDLESMVMRDGVRRRQWLAESEEGRQRMLARYRAELQSAVVDGDISTIPIEYAIERTTYGAEEGTVTVLEKFRVGTYTERKRYTYFLRRKDDIWTVVDYTVLNLGTE